MYMCVLGVLYFYFFTYLVWSFIFTFFKFLVISYNMGKNYPTVSEEYNKAVDEARRKLKDFIAENGSAPLMLRLA